MPSFSVFLLCLAVKSCFAILFYITCAHTVEGSFTTVQASFHRVLVPACLHFVLVENFPVKF